MLYDDILDHVGPFGTYQWSMFILLGFVQFPTAWQNMAMTLYAAKMDHWCRVPALANFTYDQQRQIAIPYSNDGEGEYSQCTVYDLPYANYSDEELLNWNRTQMIPEGTAELECDAGWLYDQSMFESTLVSQFDLVCDKSSQVSLIQTIYMCGFLVGCIVFGQVADKFGRKTSLTIANIMQVVMPLVATFMPVYPAYVVMRFFCGAASAGGITTLFVMMSEFIGSKYRMSAIILAKIIYSLAYVLLPGMSYAIRDHSKLQLAVALCPVALWISLGVVPESPRWLILEGRDEEATKILRKMAAVNKVELPEKLNLEENRSTNEVQLLGRNPNLSDLFRTPALRLVTLNSWFNWLVTSLVYYGLSLGVDMLPGSVFVNTCIAGAIEIPAILVCFLVMDRIGRKWTNFASLIGCGISCLLCMIFISDDEQQTASITLLMLGKFFSAATFAVIYLYATELFPTLVRTVGLGSSSMIGRVGSLIQPQVARLENQWKPAPFLFYGVMALLSGILALFFPETLGRKLPDSLEEGEEFARNITFRVRAKKTTRDDAEDGADNPAFEKEPPPTSGDTKKAEANGYNTFANNHSANHNDVVLRQKTNSFDTKHDHGYDQSTRF